MEPDLNESNHFATSKDRDEGVRELGSTQEGHDTVICTADEPLSNAVNKSPSLQECDSGAKEITTAVNLFTKTEENEISDCKEVDAESHSVLAELVGLDLTQNDRTSNGIGETQTETVDNKEKEINDSREGTAHNAENDKEHSDCYSTGDMVGNSKAMSTDRAGSVAVNAINDDEQSNQESVDEGDSYESDLNNSKVSPSRSDKDYEQCEVRTDSAEGDESRSPETQTENAIEMESDNAIALDDCSLSEYQLDSCIQMASDSTKQLDNHALENSQLENAIALDNCTSSDNQSDSNLDTVSSLDSSDDDNSSSDDHYENMSSDADAETSDSDNKHPHQCNNVNWDEGGQMKRQWSVSVSSSPPDNLHQSSKNSAWVYEKEAVDDPALKENFEPPSLVLDLSNARILKRDGRKVLVEFDDFDKRQIPKVPQMQMPKHPGRSLYSGFNPRILSSLVPEDEDLSRKDVDHLTLKIEDAMTVPYSKEHQQSPVNKGQLQQQQQHQQQQRHKKESQSKFRSHQEQLALLGNLQYCRDIVYDKFEHSTTRKKNYRRLVERFDKAIFLAMKGKKDTLQLMQLPSLGAERATQLDNQCPCCNKPFHSERALQIHLDDCVKKTWISLMNQKVKLKL